MTLLQVRQLSKRFGGIQAVREVSFDVERGEILGIIGPNGAGKSTLLELVSGFQRPDMGSVLYDGKEMVGRPAYAVSRLGIARTFQKLRPFLGMTVLENVMVTALVRERSLESARQHALEYIEFVGLAAKTGALANTLSTGQRKRLELARVMAARPALYLLDEVMAGVDHKSIGGLVDLVGQLRQTGGTIILIEHNLTVVRALCDRLMALNLGAKIADGPPARVLDDPAVVQAYVGQ